MQYQTFVAATGHPAPGHWPEGAYPPNKSNHPVVYVNWHDAVAYCQWLSEATGKECRLPTEAEWEKAAGWDVEQGVKRTYPWGDEFDASLCNTVESGIGDTTPVGVYPGGASPYGVMDMSGNVWEWCSSFYWDYPYDPDDGREDLEAEGTRVLRGGAFGNDRRSVRCTYRYGSSPYDRVRDDGFRVMVSPVISPSGL
jgi:formylglycine-generating enzyme required for sulfatase activity